MKKTFLFTLFATLTTFMFAQQITSHSVNIDEDVNATTFTSRHIERIEGVYHLHENDTVVMMKHAEYLKYIEINCPEAMNYYQKGCQLKGAGVGLLVSGIALNLAGLPMYLMGIIDGDDALSLGGYACVTVGSLAVSGSIPLLIVGTIKRNNSHKAYNLFCNSTTEFAVSLNASQNGLGVALNF